MEAKLVTELHRDDERFMRVALREAAKGLGKTSPNPAVGAVIVSGGKIIARAHHRGSGLPHAEIECLAKVPGLFWIGDRTRPRVQMPVRLGLSAPRRKEKETASRGRKAEHARRVRSPERSTMYVTLEPCSTAGRTGACTKKIIDAGIKTVVIGAIDPNPRHNGRGIAILRKAGIEVRTGVLADECAALNEAFNKWIVTRRPFVIAKCGMSLDGRLTRPPGEPRWITSAPARRHARALRASVDAIIVGAETVRADNPQLNVRGVPGARQPLIVVLTRSGNLPAKARIFQKQTSIYRRKTLQNVLVDLGRKKITSVLIEGGGEVLGQALDAHLIDKVQIYLGPILTGGPVIAFAGKGAGTTADALHLERVTYARINNDICVTGYTS